VKILPAIAAALASVAIASPANAALSNQELRLIGRSFERAGVSLVSKKGCKPGLAGSYKPSTKTITVCLGNINSPEGLDEVVAHESIHAAQHCAATALGVPGLLPISVLLSTKPDLAADWLRMVDNASAINAKGIAGSSAVNTRGITPLLEREAYAMENDPMAANGLFRAACLGE
jgi:hypothetical protein